MAKTINFEFEGVQYNLEYTRKSIEIMERRGFKISDLETRYNFSCFVRRCFPCSSQVREAGSHR